MTTRSTVLARITLPAGGGNSPNLSPPTGFRWIVKSITIRSLNTAAGDVYFLVGSTDGTVLVYLFQQNLPASGIGTVSTWTMLHATDYLRIFAPAGPIHCWVSGTVLPSPPGVP